jgi:hypothetical protein
MMSRLHILLLVIVSSSVGLVLCGNQVSAEQSPLIRRLDAFKEPSLAALTSQSEEVYRIISWPTFASPISVRGEKKSGEFLLTAKRLSGQGGYNPGAWMEGRQRKLSESEWKRLLTSLETSKFWAMESEEKPIEKDSTNIRVCLDGTTWIIEGIKESRYHYVDRYCPESKELLALGQAFLKSSKFKCESGVQIADKRVQQVEW